jgi:hypothetical protein
MEELVKQLANTARNESAVASLPLENGLQLLVYPMEEGFMVGLGIDSEQASASRTDQILRRRSGNISRFGAWLPAMFSDGSCYIFRRLPHADIDRSEPVLSHEELQLAEELLA